MSEAVEIDIRGDAWLLLAERAAFWHKRRWLFVADAHFGKAATFRALGVPVPDGTTSRMLERLDSLMQATRCEAVVFLGDLFHARQSHADATVEAMQAWRRRHDAVELILVEGNHDRAAGAPPRSLHIDVRSDPWLVDGYAFTHYPRIIDRAFAFAGHLHPAIRLHGRGRDHSRLPCFWLRAGVAVLPAFGSFTGGAEFEREEGDRVFGVAGQRVVEVPQLPSG